MKILTSNKSKYSSQLDTLEKLGINLHISKIGLPEIQTNSVSESIASKAIAAEKILSEPVLVDDVALYIEGLNKFPGPLVKGVIKGIGHSGLFNLLQGKSRNAKMICSLGISINGEVMQWRGEVEGYLDMETDVIDEKMMLSSIFKTYDHKKLDFIHRERAFYNLEKDLLRVKAKLSINNPVSYSCLQSAFQCPFCQEFDNVENSIFHELVGDRIENRVIYEDELFIILTPIGQFIEGGLLLMTKEHIPSFAHLPMDQYRKLERLVKKIKIVLEQIWEVSPIIFEHGPAIDKSKGKCCVDHAHLNIFPANVDVHSSLSNRLHSPVSKLSDLSDFKCLEDGYLYVDSVISGKFVYDGINAPSQLVRKIITSSMGMKERWHWRHYLGVDEMKSTIQKLEGKLQ